MGLVRPVIVIQKWTVVTQNVTMYRLNGQRAKIQCIDWKQLSNCRVSGSTARVTKGGALVIGLYVVKLMSGGL